MTSYGWKIFAWVMVAAVIGLVVAWILLNQASPGDCTRFVGCP